MGKHERKTFSTELKKLGSHTEETDAYLEQNRRTAAAEKNVGPLENLWVRAQVD